MMFGVVLIVLALVVVVALAWGACRVAARYDRER
jgi:hypothetical protein